MPSGAGGEAAAGPTTAAESAGGAPAPQGPAEEAPESGGADAAESTAQEQTQERMEEAAPEAAHEDASAEMEGAPEGTEAEAEGSEPAESAAGTESASESGGLAAQSAPAGAAAGSEAEGAEGPAAEADDTRATTQAPATETVEEDPEAAQRGEHARAAREEQADTQRTAESASDERAEEQAEQDAESGQASETGEADLSQGERDAGLSSLAESAGGGGEGGGGGAGGGGGGGEAAPEPEPAPDTASGDPESGLAAASTLQPMQAAQALDGVGTSIDTTAQNEGESLQSQVPEVEVGGDGSGGSAVVATAEGEGPKAPAETPAGQSQPTPEPEPLPAPGPAPTEAIAPPRVSDTAEGTVSREDATRVAASVSSMPTTDPGLNASAGPPPQLAKVGDADPSQMQDQRAELDATIAEQKTQGAADAAAPAGENEVRDRTPRASLQAPKLAAPAAGGAGGAAVADDEAVGIVAEQKQGAEVRAAMAQAQGDMAAKRADHQSKVAEEKDKSNAEIAALKEDNAAQQQAEKDKVRSEVGKARGDWTAEQNAEVHKTNEKARGEIAKGNEKIAKEEAQSNEKAAQHITEGETEAGDHKAQAEKEAAEKKREAERKKQEDSGGIFGWIASKVTAFFDALKSAITKVFDAAKKLVKAAIDKAKKLAVAVIEKARQAVVGLIKAVGAALIALGDVLLAAFPGLKKKWRAFIESKVKAAEDAVNKLADALKKGVTKLLDALGKAFEFLLDAYKKAMFAVLDAAKSVAMGAINFAKNVAQALGTFVVLIKDIARNPGQWISNLGAAVIDGIKNHLWKAFKAAVKEWFNSKLEALLGIGTTIWNVLKKGGIALKEVGQMAFEALKAAIPMALIQILVEKLVSMIVPAAGAVLAIIEGLQAAWGTIQRIIAALGKFVAFLKAVKGGGAGPQFADMLAAAAIVVIDFVANWLLRRLRGPASKVGAKVKAIAQKIMAKIKKAAKKVGKALKKAGAKVKRKFKAGKKKFDAWRAKRKAKKDARKKGKEDPNKKKKDKEEAKRERLRKAVSALQPKIDALAHKGKLSGLLLKARLGLWKVRYRLSSLRLREGGGSAAVLATVNPSEEVRRFVARFGSQLRKLIYEAADKVMSHPKVMEAAKRAEAIVEGRTATGAEGEQVTPQVESGAESLAVAKELAKKRPSGTKSEVAMGSSAGATVARDPAHRSKDPEGAPPGLQHVQGGGSYVNHPQDFKAAADAAGVSEQDLHKATIATFLGGSTVAGASQEVKDFGAQQALLKITEISRNVAGGLISLDTAREAAKGRMDTAAAVAADPMTGVSAKDKRLNPEREGYNERVAAALRETDPAARAKQVESKGAVATAKRAEELGRAGKEPRGKARRIRRVIKQQLDFVARVLQAEYEAGRMIFTNETQLTTTLQADVEKAILRRFQNLAGLSED